MKGEVFVAVGLDGFIATSRDGLKWEQKKGKEGDTLEHIAFNNGSCLIAGKRGPQPITLVSKDASNRSKI